MGRSRYAGSDVVGDHYGTWDDPTLRNVLGPDILDGVETLEHIVTAGDRLELIANQYYGDPDYWWVVALSNRILDPFSLVPGQRLRIPTDAKTILDKVHG